MKGIFKKLLKTLYTKKGVNQEKLKYDPSSIKIKMFISCKLMNDKNINY